MWRIKSDCIEYWISDTERVIKVYENTLGIGPVQKLIGEVRGFCHYDLLFDDDIDILKLMCLIKAKEIGWDIKEIKV